MTWLAPSDAGPAPPGSSRCLHRSPRRPEPPDRHRAARRRSTGARLGPGTTGRRWRGDEGQHPAPALGPASLAIPVGPAAASGALRSARAAHQPAARPASTSSRVGESLGAASETARRLERAPELSTRPSNSWPPLPRSRRTTVDSPAPARGQAVEAQAVRRVVERKIPLEPAREHCPPRASPPWLVKLRAVSRCSPQAWSELEAASGAR